MKTPNYRRQRRKSGPDYAFVELDGRRVHLGHFDDPTSRQNYDRILAEWLANGRRLPVDPRELTIVELVDAYMGHVRRKYRRPTGEPTSTVHVAKMALRPLLQLYETAPAAEFGPRQLKAVRAHMDDQGSYTRGTINKSVGLIRAMFKWAASEEMLDASIHQRLKTVDALAANESKAREPQPVQAVEWDRIAATLPFVGPEVATVVKLQWLTGARAGELLVMRPVDIDTLGRQESGTHFWIYCPAQHKNSHRGQVRSIPLNPEAQEILRPLLANCPSVESAVFSPLRAEQARRDRAHAERTTPLSCGNRPGSNRTPRPRRSPGEFYTTDAYRRHIHRACDRAFPVPDEIRDDPEKVEAWEKQHRWNPHQIRHAVARDVSRTTDRDNTRALLGHSDPRMTEHYAPLDLTQAMAVAADRALPADPDLDEPRQAAG